MANQYNNKVVLGNETLIDLTGDTVTAASLAQGYTAHDASGAPITGTMSGGTEDGHVYQDAQGYVVLDDESGKTYQTVSKSYTPTESQQTETITAGSGYDAISQVSVTVGAISSSYVGSGITSRSSSDLTASGATVTAPAGYYSSSASKSVANGYAGPPESITETGASLSAGTNTITLTKAAEVTPDVIAGYVSEGTEDRCDISLTATVNTRSSSDLTASGATVTAPAGYYASSASKSVSSGSAATPATTITANPSISVGSDGLITATASATKSVTPTVSAGYVSSGTAGTITVSGSNTSQLSTQAAKTVTPSTSSQTAVAAGKYTTGAVTVAAMPSGSVSASAAKGTVSSHSVSVTPTATVGTAGYLAAGSTNGTAVTVSASELVSGTKSISENGTGIDVTNYASVDVAVPSGGNTVTISGNGDQYNVFAQVNHTGPVHYVDGDTFTFQDGDEIYLYCSGSHAGGTIIVDGETVAYNANYAVYYNLTPPNCNLTITMSFGATGQMSVTTPTLSITSNGSYDVCDYGYANVAVPNSYGAGDEGKVVSSGALVAQTAMASITSNGTYDTTTNNSVTVNIDNNIIVSGNGNQNYAYASIGSSGTRHYTDGDVFTFSEGDKLYVYAKGSSNGATIIVNGETVGSASGTSATSRTLDLPNKNVEVQLSYGQTTTVSVSIPTLSITENGTYDVSDYGFAEVSIFDGFSETDLKNMLTRSSSFTDINWPSGMTNIGKYAFTGLNYFNPSSLPNGLTTIGVYAFSQCTRLALTSLPSGITSISNYAFYQCQNLALTSLPSGLTTITAYAFYGCLSMALTSLPSGLTTIETNGFCGCTALALTSLPNSLTSIAASAFMNCTSLALTSLPSGLTTIAASAFQNCTNLALTSLPSGLTTINTYAFQNCTSLTFTSLPSNLTSINTGAFYGCTGITEISCDGAITTFSSSAFNGSSSYEMMLESASFPNLATTSSLSTVFGSTTAANACHYLAFCDIGNATGIAANAFANCYALETLVIRKTSVASLSSTSAFTNTPMSGYNNLTGTVYVPSALISSYQTANNWKTLYNNGTVTFAAIEGSDYDLS